MRGSRRTEFCFDGWSASESDRYQDDGVPFHEMVSHGPFRSFALTACRLHVYTCGVEKSGSLSEARNIINKCREGGHTTRVTTRPGARRPHRHPTPRPARICRGSSSCNLNLLTKPTIGGASRVSDSVVSTGVYSATTTGRQLLRSLGLALVVCRRRGGGRHHRRADP